MLDGIDISNFQGRPAQYRGTDWYRDASFVIAQAIPKPLPVGFTGDQLRGGIEDGKKVGIYTWLWHDTSWRMGDGTVELDQLIRLATVPEDVVLDMRPWLDVEDDQSTGWANSGLTQRKDDVLRALDVLDTFAQRRGVPLAGIYTSPYYIERLFGGWMPDDRVQWLAHYTGSSGHPVPGSLIGGKVVAHQWASQPVDLDKMLETEIVNHDFPDVPPNPLPTDVDQGWLDRKAEIVSTAGELVSLTSQFTSAAMRKGGPRRADILTLTKGLSERAHRILGDQP